MAELVGQLFAESRQWELELKPWAERGYWLGQGWEPIAVFQVERVDFARPPHTTVDHRYQEYIVALRRLNVTIEEVER